jgi:hypothetical protein
MNFFDFPSFENEESPRLNDNLAFDNLSFNPDAEVMFQTGCNKYMLSSRNLYKSASPEEIKMNEILLEDLFKHEKMPIFTLSNSPLPSTVASISEISTPKTTLKKAKKSKTLLKKRGAYYDLDSEISVVESDYSPDHEDQEEEYTNKRFSTRASRRFSRKNTQDSLTFSDSSSEKTIINNQNKMKNHQGSIAGKIKKECKRDEETDENTRLFNEATQDLSEEKTEEFRKWASKYNKKDKTWNALKKFFASNREFAVVFVNMTGLFLSEGYKDEFEEWLGQGQMSSQTKVLLKEKDNKEFYALKFSLTLDEIQGKVSDFRNEIKKSRKSLKVF